jgi:hypothetical protein
MEVAVAETVLVNLSNVVTTSGDFLEAGQPLDRFRIDIHVLDVWHLNLLHKLLLVYLLLEHFHLFLIFLYTDVDAVHEDFSVYYAWNLESFRCNHISKANILRRQHRTNTLLFKSTISLLLI